ncbi:MAG: DUF2999 family protein [Lentisphaeria bacterium]
MLSQLLSGMNIPEAEAAKLAKLARENPMAAVAQLQNYLSPEMIESMMQMMMANPELMQQVMSQAGISDDQVDALKNQFN